MRPPPRSFFFNDTATTQIYTQSLHDAHPISDQLREHGDLAPGDLHPGQLGAGLQPAADRLHRLRVGALDGQVVDRKSTRLNFSHANISYAVFCLNKKIVYASFTLKKNIPCLS